MKKTLGVILGLICVLALAVMIQDITGSFFPRSFSSYKTAEYSIDGKPVILGTASTQYFGDEAWGDMNGDGVPDVAFLFIDQPGGSGTFYYVAVAIAKKNSDGTTRYIGTNAVFIGDRIAPQGILIQNGNGVLVTYAERAESDPMTTPPHIGISSFYQFEKGNLVYKGSR